jgi:hypothetical protein
MATRPDFIETKLLDPKCLRAPLFGIDTLAARSEMQLIEVGPTMRAGTDIIVPGRTPLDFFVALKSYDDAMSRAGPKTVKIAADSLLTVSAEIAAISDRSALELKDLSSKLPSKPWGDLRATRTQIDQALSRLVDQGRQIRIPTTRGKLLADDAIDSLLDSSDILKRIDASRVINERSELIGLLKKQIEREPNKYIEHLGNQAVTLKRTARGLAALKYVLVVAPVIPALYDVYVSWNDQSARDKALDQLILLGKKTVTEVSLGALVDLAVPAVALLFTPAAGGFLVVTSVFLGVGVAGGFLVDGISDAYFKGSRIDAGTTESP